jgi:hypothetical protein
MYTLLTLPLRCKRDALLARQRARQIAAMFHFGAQDQTGIAAGAFTVAAQTLKHSRSHQMCIQIDKKALHIFTELPAAGPQASNLMNGVRLRFSQGNLRLVKVLPATADLADVDLAWVVRQLDRCADFRPFEELQHQNQEMLALLSALRSAQAQIEQLKAEGAIASAA